MKIKNGCFAFIITINSLSCMLHSITEKPFVIVIPSYNNAQWYKKNLDSVCMQQYDNWRVIYIDDCSPDGTGDLVQAYIQLSKFSDRFVIIKNKERYGALANHYTAVHLCADDEIVVQLDGDDWFSTDTALQRINKEYQNQNVWLTYGQYEADPIDQPGISKPMPRIVIERNGYREFNWITSAPRTFYAGLFKCIRLQDLLYEGHFFQATCDGAFMFPMLELSAGRIAFIPDILYIYNCNTQINDFKLRAQLQQHLEYVIRGQKKYKKLHAAPWEQQKEQKKKKSARADLILIARSVADTTNFLSSLASTVKGVSSIFVLVEQSRASDFMPLREQLNKNVHLISWNDDFSAVCRDVFARSETKYVLLACDTSLSREIDCASCIAVIEQTKALACYCALNTEIRPDYLVRDLSVPPLLKITNQISAWQFAQAEYEWRTFFSWNMVIYRTASLKQWFAEIKCATPEQCQRILNLRKWDVRAVGLCVH